RRMPRSILHTSCLALYVIAAIHVATRPTICYGASLAKRAIERETDRILPVLFGVDISDGHNAGLEVAPMEIEHDDPRSSSLALKPDDNLDTISLEAYAALVPELFVCQFGSKGTISELLKYLRNPPFSLAGDKWIQRIDNTRIWLYSKGIEMNNGFKTWDRVPEMYQQVKSDFDTIKAREVLKTISLERYLELAHVVLGSSQYWHNELNHYLIKKINLEDWAKERVNKLAYWTIMFLKTYEIKPKNYDLESGSHEHLVQNLLKDLMKVYVTRYESIKYDMKPIDLNLLVSSFDKKTFPSKDRNKPGREQVRYMQNKQLHLCLLIHPILTSLLMSNSCSLSKIRFSGVEEHNEHNTSLKEAQVKREKDDSQLNVFSLKPEDTLDTISLEVYAALVPELYRCRFGNKGTILELLKYLDLPKHEALKQRIDNTMKWLYAKGIEINTRYKEWTNGPGLYREVESDFETMFCGVNRSNGHNTGLEEAQVERGKDDIQTSSLSLEPEDTLNTISLKAYAALVPELFYRDSSGVTRLLEGMNRGYNGLTTPLFGFNPRILENNGFKLWDLLPIMHKQVESDFDMISLERYLELAHVVLGSSQYWHKELEPFLVYVDSLSNLKEYQCPKKTVVVKFDWNSIRNDMELREWAKERGYILAYLTIIFLRHTKKNYDLESENHEHLIQNLLKGLMKVFSGVGEHNKHNTGLKEAQVSRRKVHTQSHTFSLKPEDTLDKISLEAYAALVSDLYRCRFGNKGTIPELLKYLDKRNPPPSLPKDEAERKRIYDTRMWLHTKDIEINTSYKHWAWGPFMYREVESEFNTMDVLDHHHSLHEQKSCFKLSSGKMYHPTQNRKAKEAFPRMCVIFIQDHSKNTIDLTIALFSSLEIYLELAPVVLGYPHDCNQDLRLFLGCGGLVWLESQLLLILVMTCGSKYRQNIHFADGQQERGCKLAFWTVWFLKLHHFDVKKYDLQTKNQGTMAHFLMNDLVKAYVTT
ncbi:hypothetical protein PSHT_04555, partial [Puccinia striiformis]